MRIVYENNHIPEVGKYNDTVVEDVFSNNVYLYDCEGSYINLGLDFFRTIDGGSA